jgi:putative MATE family efflux protein
MGADAEVLPLGVTYLRVTFLGAGTWVLVYVINPLLRGAGEARKPMLALFLTAAVTIISEPFLVLGLGPFPELGVAGAALSTILGFGAGLLLQIAFLVPGRSNISLRLRHLRPDLPLMLHIIRIALPCTVQMFLRSASLMAIFALVGAFGTYATAGYGLADRLLTLTLVPCFGLGNAAATLVGQNLGALKAERAERSALWVAGYTGSYMLVATTTLMLLAPTLLSLFDATPEVVAIGTRYILIAALSIAVDSVGFILGRSMEGAGLTLPATIINLLTLWGLQIPVAYVLSRWSGLGLVGIWWARAMANVANAALFAIVFRRGRWKEREV